MSFLPCAFGAINVFMSQKWVLPTNRLYSAEDSKLGGTVADSLTGHSITKSFGAEKREQKRLKKASQAWQSIAQKAWLRVDVMAFFQNIMVFIGRVGALLLAGWYWSQNVFTAGDVIYVLMAQRHDERLSRWYRK